MMWNDFLHRVLAAAVGMAIGSFYFYGLWWTLCRIPSCSRPKFWLGISWLVRLSGALIGFWLVMRKDAVSFFLPWRPSF